MWFSTSFLLMFCCTLVLKKSFKSFSKNWKFSTLDDNTQTPGSIWLILTFFSTLFKLLQYETEDMILMPSLGCNYKLCCCLHLKHWWSSSHWWVHCFRLSEMSSPSLSSFIRHLVSPVLIVHVCGSDIIPSIPPTIQSSSSRSEYSTRASLTSTHSGPVNSW